MTDEARDTRQEAPARPKPRARLATFILSWLEPNIRQFRKEREPLLWALALVAGMAAGILAIVFREGIGLVQWVWTGYNGEQLVSRIRALPAWQVFLGPVLGGLIVGLLLEQIPSRRTGAVADVIEARALTGRKLSKRDGAWSAVLTVISLGSGASAGREGPVVHLGATFATAIGTRFGLPEWARRTLLASGVASAVAASFNAPIAGVLFAHEVILGHYAMRSLVPVVIAAAAGGIAGRLWFGDFAAFSVPAHEIASYWEFPAFVLLGITSAAIAIAFQMSLFTADYVARRIPMQLWMRPVAGGAVIGATGLFLPEILGVGYEVTDQALHNRLGLSLMLVLIAAKTAATAITLASRFGGGVFSPALFLGALTGSSFGIIAASAFPDMASSHGLYAMLGMGAVAGAVLGAPISTAMIVFELTGGYALSIALLLTTAVAQGVTHAIHGRSWFHWQLEMRGLPVLDGPHRVISASVRVMDFMDVPADMAREAYDPANGRPALRTGDSLETALRAFDSGGHARLPVLDPTDETRILAWVTQARALAFFNRALVAASEEEHR